MTQHQLIRSLETRLYIDGVWTESQGRGSFDVEDPSTGEILTTVADASPEDGVAALEAAARAQASWAATPPRVRGDILRRAFDSVTARAEDFATLMTLEMGKPIAEARTEVTYGAEFLRWFSEEAVRISGRYSTAPDGKTRLLVHKRPVGPCLLITPWNFPLAMVTRKVGPAIAAGCTMVLKPPSLTPLTSLLLTQVLHDAGLPPGVLNVVPTAGSARLTERLLADGRLRKLSFTGSTEVGRSLLRLGANSVLRCSMELGGNAPFLVFEDAVLENAVEGAMLAKLRNMGEACTAANRFIVHESIAADFSGRLAEAMGRLTVGSGLDPESAIGPLIDEKSRGKVDALVQDAVNRGATLRTGGKSIDQPGYFYPPTVVDGIPPDADILREEIFGPVAPIVTFATEEEAIALANDTEYGLAGYAYTRDLERVLRLTEAIEVGMLGINTGVVSNPAAPFGGVKQSGLGREGGLEGIEEYLETRYVGLAGAI
ncbi:NAD-dependent succinate-semialdehyde dehydrogenase [Nocardioides sp. NPDC006273]|uniref:NAD-dependent succinate-semialdehyde dehydrogenase n=1 Tax=Nocardioides sp. NPDC006273 TaxID=3155598 RepID=UPI0033B13B20